RPISGVITIMIRKIGLNTNAITMPTGNGASIINQDGGAGGGSGAGGAGTATSADGGGTVTRGVRISGDRPWGSTSVSGAPTASGTGDRRNATAPATTTRPSA